MLVERAKKLRWATVSSRAWTWDHRWTRAQMNTVLQYIEIGKKEGEAFVGGERLSGREVR